MKKIISLFLILCIVLCSASFVACVVVIAPQTSTSQTREEAPMKSLVLKDQPHKTEYVIGETFDVTGATLQVTLTDDSVKIVDVTAEMLSGNLTFTKAGKQAIMVTYTRGEITKQAVIYVNVTDPNTVVTPL